MTLYHELIDSLIDKIKSMDIGQKLPSERQLCEDYNVSRTTVRSAISDLEIKGYVTRIQGSGTFVADPSSNRQNLSNYYSFTEQTKKIGKTPKSVIIEYHIEVPPLYIQEIMGLKPKDETIIFDRLRLADDDKMMLETTYIPYKDFKQISKELLETHPLYEIFEKIYSRKITKVNEEYSVIPLTNDNANLLEVDKKMPALEIKRKSFDNNDKIIEYTISIARGDKFNYETTYYPN